MEMLVLLLAIAMVVPLPFEEIVGGYVRLRLVPIEDAHNHRRFLRMEVVQPLLLQGVKLAFPCCCLLKIRAYLPHFDLHWLWRRFACKRARGAYFNSWTYSRRVARLEGMY